MDAGVVAEPVLARSFGALAMDVVSRVHRGDKGL
jgi:hypothetical protein